MIRNTVIVCREKLDNGYNELVITLFQCNFTNNGVSGFRPFSKNGKQASANYRRLQFDNNWLGEAELEQVVKASWNQSSVYNFIRRWKSCIGEIEKWGRNHNSEFWKKWKQLQKMLEEARDVCDDRKVQLLYQEWNFILYKEDYRNIQNAKQKWLLHGGKNSKFFHASIRARCRKAAIEKL